MRKQLRIRRMAIWLSLILLVAAALSALALVRGISSQIEAVAENYNVRHMARELTHALVKAESYQRGYLLTSDETFLGPFEAALVEVEQRVAELIVRTETDPEQSARLQGVLGELSRKILEMSSSVDLMVNDRQDDAMLLSSSGFGARLMTEVSATLEAFIAEEDHKLAQRNVEIDRFRSLLFAALIAALAAAAVLTYAIVTRSQREVSVLTARQSGLLTQNEALEAQVAERTQAIEEARARAENERQRVEALLQDTNHRIGNSLATVSSLLALQEMRSKSPEVKKALEAARQRVHTIASAHRRLRLSDDFESTSASELLDSVLADISDMQVDGDRIKVRGEFAPTVMNSRDATTLGILVSELVTNSFKHAFPGDRSGEIVVRLRNGEAGVPILEIEDNGVGAPPEDGQETGLGTVIVRQLAGQFGGEPVYRAREGGGLLVSIDLPSLRPAQPGSSDME